jgi:hypothetical protein
MSGTSSAACPICDVERRGSVVLVLFAYHKRKLRFDDKQCVDLLQIIRRYLSATFYNYFVSGHYPSSCFI